MDPTNAPPRPPPFGLAEWRRAKAASDRLFGDCGHGARALLADGEQMNLDLVSTLLRHLGVSDIRTTRDPAAVVRLCRDFRPDLVLLDMGLPRMDGLAVLRALRGELPLASPAILVCAARRDWDRRLEALELGARDVVPKPFDPCELIARIGGVLEGEALRRALTRAETLRAEIEARVAQMRLSLSALCGFADRARLGAPADQMEQAERIHALALSLLGDMNGVVAQIERNADG